MATYYLENFDSKRCVGRDFLPPHGASHITVTLPRRFRSLDPGEINAAHRLSLVSDLTLKPHYGDSSPSDVDLALAGEPMSWSSGSWSGVWGRRASRMWGFETSFSPPSSTRAKFAAQATGGWPLQTITELSSSHPEYPERKNSDPTASKTATIIESATTSHADYPELTASKPGVSGLRSTSDIDGGSSDKRIVLGGSVPNGTGPPNKIPRKPQNPLEEIATGVHG